MHGGQADALQQGGRGLTVPAEVDAPDHPINAETALEYAAPHQAIIRFTGTPVAREGGLPH